MITFAPRTGYTAAERRSDAVVHVTGVALVLVAVPVLIGLAVTLRGDARAIVGTAVYGVALVAMIACSALYNMITRPGWDGILRRMDHSAIYCKIAGTYTPFALLPGGQAGWFLAGIWGVALAGTSLKVLAPARLKYVALALYLGLGWAGVFAGDAFLGGLPQPVLILIVTGGVLYTVGVGFFLFDRMPFHYTVWHVFVLIASLVLYAAVTLQLVTGPGLSG